MRIHEIINEGNEQRFVESKNIPKELNGGRIDIIINSSDVYPIESYSYSYINDKVTKYGPVLSFEVDVMRNEVTQYHHTRYPEGMTLRNISDEQIRSEFASGVTEYFGRFIREGNTKMPNNNPWNEYSELRDVVSIMNKIVRQASETREILRSQMNENYVNQIEENISVNMSSFTKMAEEKLLRRMSCAKNTILDNHKHR